MNELTVAGVALVMAIGLMGTIVPFLPGLSLVWLAALAYGLIEGFGTAGWIAMALITLLFAASLVVKVILPQREAREGGTPRSSLFAGIVLGVIGFFVIPVVGLPVGAALGVLLAEFRRTDDWSAAWRSTRAVIVGFGMGILFEMVAGALMVASWITWVIATL